MNEVNVADFVAQLLAGKRPFLHAIFSYPHPFTEGGIIVVVADDMTGLLDLIGEAHQLLPSGLAFHCVRQRELFQLSLPGLFAPPFVVNERPFLPQWLNHKGKVWWGADIRHLVQPTITPPQFLTAHLEGCRDSLRRYGILPALLRQKYTDLWVMLELEMLRLMGTAVLLHDQWDIDTTTLPALFAQYFSGELASLWPQLVAQRQRLESEPEAAAYEAVWLFETFIRHLEAYT
jgi:hypothetical protein